ncbi:MAG: glycoside hydrolase family 25 protein [Microthrixaceae bacterium]|nr:glycoside hydrolase family 25 protein [Microthrixaceae bacterium]
MSARRVLVFTAALVMALTATAVPAGAIDGIDVSRWQHPNGATIDWGAVRQSGQRFVFIKATEGATASAAAYVNPHFAGDWSASAAAGLLRGAYHYAQPSMPADSALIQARNFIATTGSMQGATDLPPVLDIEATNGLSPADMVTWIATWLFEVERLTGRRPIIYTGLSFWNNQVGGSSAFAAYRLWFARYVAGPTPGQIPTGFLTWTFWQRSSTGSVPGISAAVDLNTYCCAEANLLALAGPSTNPNAGSPFGGFDIAGAGPDGFLTVAGWTIDPDRPGPIVTHVYIDGQGTDMGAASASRADIGAAYGQFGPGHGFAWSRNGVAPGPHQVCVFGINEGYGTNTLLGCKNVVVPGGDPVGVIDSFARPDGRIDLIGWTLDPDTVAPTEVHAYIDGVGHNLGLAELPRPDIAAAFPGYGPAHGIATTLSGLSGGPHQLCLFAINRGTGSTRLLRCQGVTVPTGDPLGRIDTAIGLPDGKLRISGWTVDPDTTTPTEVHLYVDGVGHNLGLADRPRPDIATAFDGYGHSHGFDAAVGGLAPGPHQACLFAINRGAGSNRLLECRSVTVPGGSPFGIVDEMSVDASGFVSLRGWTIDPDTAEPTEVHAYVGGTGTNLGTADQPRPDIAAAFDGYGAAHGFSGTIGALAPGPQTVCVFAINRAGGANTLLRCATPSRD